MIPASPKIVHIMDVYAKASGQVINYDHVCYCFQLSHRDSKKNVISRQLKVKMVQNHGKYLGVLSSLSNNKYQCLVLRIKYIKLWRVGRGNYFLK